MVYYEDWEGFVAAARELFNRRSLQTRYSLRYSDSSKEAILKVTDDVQCLQFSVKRPADARRVETFSQLFVGWATTQGVQLAKDPQQLPASTIATTAPREHRGHERKKGAKKIGSTRVKRQEGSIIGL